MCRVNELMKGWDNGVESNNGGEEEIQKSMAHLDYVDLPQANSPDECTLLCTQEANKMLQPGCCEFRVEEEGNCTWVGANGHPYLASEYRFSHINWGRVIGTSKDTMSVLCNSGKII